MTPGRRYVERTDSPNRPNGEAVFFGSRRPVRKAMVRRNNVITAIRETELRQGSKLEGYHQRHLFGSVQPGQRGGAVFLGLAAWVLLRSNVPR
jgi:hypothetical protein